MRFAVFFCLMACMPSKVFSAEGSLIVSARNIFGVPFTNPNFEPTVFQFYAYGKWAWRVDNICSAQGAPSPCKTYGSCPLNTQNVGALIIRQGANFIMAGEYIELTLDSAETIYFSINDAIYRHKDNDGFLEIIWQSQ